MILKLAPHHCQLSLEPLSRLTDLGPIGCGVGYHNYTIIGIWNRHEPVHMAAGPKHLLTEFGIYPIMESCRLE